MRSNWADQASQCHCPGCIAAMHDMQTLHPRVPPAPQATNDDSIPFLTLCGEWLAKMGFPIGTEVRVEAWNGRIIIDVLEPHFPKGREIHYMTVEDGDAV